MRSLEFLGKLGEWGPVLFGLGFIAPLIAQSMDAAGVAAPFGLTPLQLGLIIGPSMGLVAKLRRSWI